MDNKSTQSSRSFQFMPLSLHIETLGAIATPLVLRGTPLPTTRQQIFSTGFENQESVEIHLLLGESPLAQKNQSLGKFHLKGIPKAPRGVPRINITFSVDKDCKITITATLNGSKLRVEETADDIQKYLTPKAALPIKSGLPIISKFCL